MKKGLFRMFFIAACFMFSLQSQAQVDSVKAEKIQGQLIDSICGCITKSDPSKIKTVEDIQNTMVQCGSSPQIQILFMQYALAAGIDLTNPENLQTVMQSFSMNLAMKCPAMMTIMMNISKDPAQMQKVMDQYNKTETMPAESKPVVPQKN